MRLVILSNIDGIYDGNPKDESSKVIRKVNPGEDLSKYISAEKSSAGRGGMESKCNIALKTADAGIRVMIANGNTEDILIKLAQDPENTIHTEFIPK